MGTDESEGADEPSSIGTDKAEDAAELVDIIDHFDVTDADDTVDPIDIVELLDSTGDGELGGATSSSLSVGATFTIDILEFPLVVDRALI